MKNESRTRISEDCMGKSARMHLQEEFEAILCLFDGEISIYEKKTPEGIKQTLRVRKLLNQKYLDKEIVLTKEKLS